MTKSAALFDGLDDAIDDALRYMAPEAKANERTMFEHYRGIINSKMEDTQRHVDELEACLARTLVVLSNPELRNTEFKGLLITEIRTLLGLPNGTK